MRFQVRKKHMIDFLFPVTLFFVFTLTALIVILLSARIYKNTTENSAKNDTARTSLAYVSEKIHQNDCNGTIYLSEFDGCRSLVMESVHEDERYFTYIYVYGQELRELFIKEGTEVSAASGKIIMKIENFSMEAISDNLLRFSCSDSKGDMASMIVGIKSK